MSTSDTSAQDVAVEAVLAGGGLGQVSELGLSRLLEALAKEYGKRWQDGQTVPAFPAGSDIAATDIMVFTTAMLKAVNLQPFELGMWQAWTGNG